MWIQIKISSNGLARKSASPNMGHFDRMNQLQCAYSIPLHSKTLRTSARTQPASLVTHQQGEYTIIMLLQHTAYVLRSMYFEVCVLLPLLLLRLICGAVLSLTFFTKKKATISRRRTVN